ncbi:YbgA family protein [Gudongella sp. DL1XJH-153]|uniref:YbgA family protein n=1 Tax=Gudongella sp. DL1XJH-153 TaxID=3409804 RepID=UPI003BB7F048
MSNKPVIVVSNCLGFCNCRYDGQVINDKFVKDLESYVEYITVCPEVDIGLGVPRDSVKLVKVDGKAELYQPGQDRYVTKEMDEYSEKFLSSLDHADGFILKGRSPSCGIKDVKYYQSMVKGASSEKGVGRFAEKVFEKFPFSAIEEEGRLTNLAIREHFLTKLYTNMRFREIKDGKHKDLVDFHTRHKYILMSYSQKELKSMGKIVANHQNKKYEDLYNEYKEHLGSAMEKAPKFTNQLNTLMHVMGYFSDYLSKEEKEYLLKSLDKYRKRKIHLSVPVGILRGYAIKYKQEYILGQYLWEPFPEDMLDISDTGK